MKMASSSALLKNIHRYQKRGTELRICGSQLLSAVLLKTSRTLRRNATTSNFCPKLSCAAFPIRSASPDTRASLLIAHAKLLKNVRRKLKSIRQSYFWSIFAQEARHTMYHSLLGTSTIARNDRFMVLHGFKWYDSKVLFIWCVQNTQTMMQ